MPHQDDYSSITRRPILCAGLGLALQLPLVGQEAHASITVAQVIDRIKSNVGVPWRQQTVDNLIAGSPTAVVKGIATTMMATLDVLKRASAAGCNMVITHESTFFSHQDNIEQLPEQL